MITQLSVFLENAPGRLSALASALGRGSVNMHSLVLADTSDFGVVRILCDKPLEAKSILEDDGLSVFLTHVCAVEIPDEPGSLARLLGFLGENEIDIAYTYCFVEPTTRNAVSVFKLHSNEAVDLLRQAGYRILSDEDLNL